MVTILVEASSENISGSIAGTWTCSLARAGSSGEGDGSSGARFGSGAVPASAGAGTSYKHWFQLLISYWHLFKSNIRSAMCS